MRILMVSNTYAPARNGVATWVALSVRELRRAGHDVSVLTYRHDERPPSRDGVVELQAWAGLDRDFRVGPVPSDLPVEATPGAWDVVHVHHPVLLGPAGVRIGRSAGAKVLFTCHSVYTDYADEYYWGAMKFLKEPFTRRVVRFTNACDVAVVPSTRTGRWLRDGGVTSRIELLDTPADTTRISPVPRAEARAQLGLTDEPLALYVGRLADEKRVDVLVREFCEGCCDIPGATLALAGSGVRARAVARQVERRGLADRVRLLGTVEGSELGLWYSAADVCTSASRSEGGPLTVVEAMACGCPNVALKAPGFEDRIRHGDNGLLVDDVPGELGRAIGLVLRDADLRERLRAGAVAHSAEYTPEANVRRMLEIYASS